MRFQYCFETVSIVLSIDTWLAAVNSWHKKKEAISPPPSCTGDSGDKQGSSEPQLRPNRCLGVPSWVAAAALAFLGRFQREIGWFHAFSAGNGQNQFFRLLAGRNYLASAARWGSAGDWSAAVYSPVGNLIPSTPPWHHNRQRNTLRIVSYWRVLFEDIPQCIPKCWSAFAAATVASGPLADVYGYFHRSLLCCPAWAMPRYMGTASRAEKPWLKLSVSGMAKTELVPKLSPVAEPDPDSRVAWESSRLGLTALAP